MRVIAFSITLGLSILALVIWSSYPDHILPFPQSSSRPEVLSPNNGTVWNSDLAESALGKVLSDAVPIFGEYENAQTDTSSWMAAYPDEVLLVHMNIPGVHDAATWNYSDATQRELKKVTDLVNSTLSFSSNAFRCQDNSLIKMLNAGIRVFDLRYALDPTKTSVTFWHGPALLSETANLENVLFGVYQWLDDHPTEALFLSFQYEPSKDMANEDSKDVQTLLYSILTNSAAKRYIRRRRDELGTLGDARGHITLLRRFDLNKLPREYKKSVPGLHFSPNDWVVNGKSTTIRYNPSSKLSGESGTAYIQDYYMPSTPKNSSTADNIEDEMKAIVDHFRLATQTERERDLFWHFMSCVSRCQIATI
jgi:1-phosphatidylinositol phosphodiesterase